MLEAGFARKEKRLTFNGVRFDTCLAEFYFMLIGYDLGLVMATALSAGAD